METISTTALNVINNVKQAIQKSITGVSFVSIKNYTNKQNEIANHLFNIGIKYQSAKAKDIEFLDNLDLTAHNFKSPLYLLQQAKDELLVGFLAPEQNRSNGQLNAYTTICEGIKVHNTTGALYIFGYREKKDVIKQGEYKTVNSKPLTIAKDEIRKLLKTNKFVNFSLEVGNTLKLNGNTIEL